MENQTNVALISGGARGMGAAFVERLARGGMKVIAGDLLDEEGEALATRLREAGLAVLYHHLDVTQEDDWQAIVAAAETWAGAPVDVLVNNAGIATRGRVDTLALAEWQRVLDVNVTGVLLGMRAVVDPMTRAGSGVIVNVSSTSGLIAYRDVAPYVTSKWAVRGLTKAAALDLAPKKIRVVSMHPGPIRTPMTADLDNRVSHWQPIPRFGRVEEVAEMVWFLVTAATYSTGSEFIIDGGAITGQVPPSAYDEK